MLAHPEESLITDGRAVSDLTQGVTLEVMGEISMGPLSPADEGVGGQASGRHQISRELGTRSASIWRCSRSVASLPTWRRSSARGPCARTLLGEADVQPTTADQLESDAGAREAGDGGGRSRRSPTRSSTLPTTYAKTPELIALAKTSAACGGIYTVHMRSEGDRLEQGGPGDDRHRACLGRSGRDLPFQAGRARELGQDRTPRSQCHRARLESQGVRISADMYVYTAGATGLDASMPSWVQDGGLEAWIKRLQDPVVTSAGQGRDADAPSDHVGESVCRSGAGRSAPARVQEPQAEAAGGQDARADRARAGHDRRRTRRWTSS